MGFFPRLAPYSVISEIFDVDPAADKTYHVFTFPTQGQFINAYITNDAAVATATNTVAVYITKLSSNNATIQGTLASFAAGSTWAADVTRTGTKTAFGSTSLFASGEHIGVEYDESTTGLLTDAFFQLDYVLGYEQGTTPSAASPPS